MFPKRTLSVGEFTKLLPRMTILVPATPLDGSTSSTLADVGAVV